MKLKNQIIVLVSNEQWSDIWFSKHHYANELSQKNKVLFINPPKQWNIKNVFFNTITTTRISSNLEIVSYQNYFPFTLK